MFGVTLVLMFLMEGVAVASILTPILATYAASTGIPLTAVALMEAIALGTYFFRINQLSSLPSSLRM